MRKKTLEYTIGDEEEVGNERCNDIEVSHEEERAHNDESQDVRLTVI